MGGRTKVVHMIRCTKCGGEWKKNAKKKRHKPGCSVVAREQADAERFRQEAQTDE